MKKIFAFALSCVLCFGLVACGGSSTSTASEAGGANSEASTTGEASTPADDNSGRTWRSVEEIQASGELIMLTNAAFEPYEYEVGGEVVGVDPDLVQMIADELGVELRIIDADFDGLPMQLQSGRGDIIAAGMGYTEERAEMVDFSIQYVLNGHLVIVPIDNDTITGVDDLNGLTIAVQEGTTAEDFVLDDLEGANVMSFKDAVQAGEAVATGRADAAIMDIKPAEGIVNNNPDSVKLVDGLQLSDEDMCMAVGKGNQELLEIVNKILAAAKEDGTIDALVEKHMAATAQG